PLTDDPLLSIVRRRIGRIAGLDSALARQRAIGDLMARLGPDTPPEALRLMRELVLLHGSPSTPDTAADTGVDVEWRYTELARHLRPERQPADPAPPDIGPIVDAVSDHVVADTETVRTGRFATGALRELIEIRDQTCRTPYCDAPIRDVDHITPDAGGGATTTGNLQGLCQACNLTKDLPTRHLRRPPGT
ncbi:MAG: HNH endonuclease, partial [Propionibacterium sp.]|nr:HNH endonuclease [Propionibacterium sp.]